MSASGTTQWWKKTYYMQCYQKGKGFVQKQEKSITANDTDFIFTTNEAGKITLTGIDNGSKVSTVWAYEIEAPSGYEVIDARKKLSSKFEFPYYPMGNAEEISVGKVVTVEEPQAFGNLELTKVDQDNQNIKIDGVQFQFYNKTIEKWVKVDSSGNVSFVDSSEEASTFTTGASTFSNGTTIPDSNGKASTGFKIGTNLNGKIVLKDIAVGEYMAYEVGAAEGFSNYYEPIGSDGVKFTVASGSTATKSVTNKRTYADISGIVWLDNIDKVKKSEKNGLYMNSNSEQDLLLEGIQVRLVHSVNSAKNMEVTTNKDGYYEFKKVLIDDIPYYDVVFTYNGMSYEPVKVTIGAANGNKTAETTQKIETKEEIAKDRTTFNDNYATITKGKSNAYNLTYLTSNHKSELSYREDKNTGKCNYGNEKNQEDRGPVNGIDNQYMIEASTLYGYGGHISKEIDSDENKAKNLIKTTGRLKVENINLGLQTREQPDIALVKDLQSVNVSVNGYGHTYEYSQRFNNATYYSSDYLKEYVAKGGKYYDKDENGDYKEVAEGKYIKDEKGQYVEKEKLIFNVGVKFGNKYGDMSYTRPIYKSDYLYEDENEDNQLKVSVTYKLTIGNQSSNLTAQINSILDYYDNKYKIVGAGTKIDEKGNTIGDIAHLDGQGNLVGDITDTDYNESYKKAIINHTMRIEAQKEDTIYIQFALNREAVINILNDQENLDNVAEINSYSIYDGEKIYAGIDRDSNPGNCIPGDTKTYEDDTDSSPALKLEVAAERKMAGKVFLDSTSGDLQKNEIRQGSGIYEEGEEGIEGVEVTLRENTGSGMVYTENTDANGDFLIEGYIPGDYTLTYTWGDKTYTVQNYKGTVYKPKERYQKYQNDKNWYKQEVDTRYTDAIDNYDTEQSAPRGSRIQIDEEMNTVGIEKVTRTKMDATTPTMGIGIEEQTDGNSKYGRTLIESEMDGDKFVPKGFYIKNIDFGIVERARQVLDISKDVTGVKITLTNGQAIVDAKIVNGKLQGDNIKGLTYMGPSNGNNGTVKAEIDNELIQGSTIQIEYTINVKNNSEKDYDSGEYYKYGTEEGNVIQIKSEGVYDYLDSEMELNSNRDDGKWKEISRSEYNETHELPTMIENYFNEGKKTETRPDGTEVTVYKWEASEDSYQNLFTEWATKITEERTVREAKLDNKIILRNAELEREFKPGESKSVNIYSSKVLSNTDEIDLNNDTEITEIRRVEKTGRMPDIITSHTYDRAETVTVTPPTGENQNYILPIIIGVTALMILGAGVVLMKKKVM